MVAASELTINTTASALDMANAMFGAGITVVGATYTGASDASGIYSGGLTTSPGVVPSDAGVILSTGRVTDFTNSSGNANQLANTSTSLGTAGDAQLTAIAGFQTYDAAVLTATFIPDGDVLTMQIVFSSEEYLEYVGTQFNDATAIWVNGVQAELTVGTGDITINNVNTTSNSNLYIDNPASTSPYNTEMDGFTVTLTLKAPVNAGVQNTIKIAIADAGDRIYDSNLMVIGESVQVALIAQDDHIEVSRWGETTHDILANDTSTIGATLTITHINGQPVVAGSEVTLGTGEVIVVNADGTITVQPNAELTENTFTYTVQDSEGNTDVAFVTVKTVPCFAKGTRILTATGEVAVEDLRTGDRVVTRDNGLQPLRWVGSRRVAAQGVLTPVRIAAGTFGDHETLVVSQQHRILVRGARAQLAMGTDEVLVKARHLLDDGCVILDRTMPEVTYFHLMFDQHEIVWSNGLQSESFHPGAQALESMDEDAREEVLTIFPELRINGTSSYGPLARPALKEPEARALLSA